MRRATRRRPASEPSPSAPAGPPPGWTPPPPPTGAAGAPVVRRRGKTWLVVLISVVAVVFVAGILGTVLFFDRSYPPYEAARDFVDRIERREFVAADAQLCSAERGGGTIERFRTAIDLADASDLSPNPLSVDRDGDRATVDFRVNYRNRDDRSYELRLVRENGDWKPCPFRG